MNFALSIIVLTLVVALICFYPLLRSVKAKEDKKRDELNKALYFSRLKEIEQDNQQGLVGIYKKHQRMLKNGGC